MFNLSRDYQKAFELIKSGDRLVCLLDCDGCRDVGCSWAFLPFPYKAIAKSTQS
jgi:hypothetical protein